MKLRAQILLLALTAGVAALAMAGLKTTEVPPESATESQLDVDAWFV
jgi:hypothetical protein